MIPNNRLTAATGVDLAPFLFWSEATVSTDGAPLACPQCAGPNLHLDAVHFATPSDDHYTPTIGMSINPDTGVALTGDEARRLHACQNRGPMLAIGYWCENGCQGHIDLRGHKGHLFVSLHNNGPCSPAVGTPECLSCPG